MTSDQADRPDQNGTLRMVLPENLSSHEQIMPERVREVMQDIEREGTLNVPLLVDRSTRVILDGHHRYNALQKLGAKRIPCLEIKYLNNQEIKLEPGPNCPLDTLNREDVLEMGQSDSLFPPKSTRHRVTFNYPEITIPLRDLKEAPDR
ncbi:MAG: ParB N-terminal domain-containing protein [bacterium]